MNATLPKEIYVTLAGTVDPDMSKRVIAGFSRAVNDKAEVVHLLVQSTGGAIGDGVGIHNFLRNLPIKIIAYNGGTVASIAVILFLAAQTRKASATGNFIIHKSYHTLPSGNAENLSIAANGLKLEDDRTESILKQHLTLTKSQWNIHERGNLTITAKEALKVGLVHEIADFSPPQGTHIFNL